MVSILQNPFQQQTDETDIIVSVEGKTLHLYSGLLSVYSPVLRDTFLSKRENPDADVHLLFNGKTAKDVVLFFRMFYPEHKLKIVHELEIIENLQDVRGVLENSSQYQTGWIDQEFDQLLCSQTYQKKFTDSLDTTFDVLLLADQFNLTNLTEKLANSLKSHSFACCRKHPKFEVLKADTKLKILVERLKQNEHSHSFRAHYLHSATYPKEVIRSITDTLLNIGGVTASAVQNEDQTSDVQNKDHLKTPNNKSVKQNPGQDQAETPGEEWEANSFDTDVHVQLDDGSSLCLHSAVLCHCSPVFKAMLTGNFKEAQTKRIKLPNKKCEHFVELLKFCYVNTCHRMSETTNYHELLLLCEEYQMDWLTAIIECYLIKSHQFCGRQEASGLLYAERFRLDALRKVILHDARDLKVLKETQGDAVTRLSESTKYELTRASLAKHWYLFSQDSTNKEHDEVFDFLDSCFKK